MENFSKKPRGRPRLLSPTHEEGLRTIWHDLRSQRSIRERHYMARAYKVLRDLPGFEYLLDGQTGHLRRTILSALGRIRRDEDLVAVARVVCARKPPTAEAVQVIRLLRCDFDARY